ncbi:sigma-70 family RNA polymerase sigma factor [Bacteroidales bacterium OttesenSCG-928-L03]|nr:sigma-70 family RNA polymerase sigma factor [Bacteroidales bacterium OttesenSCG-928-L03]
MELREVDLEELIAGCRRKESSAMKRLYEFYAPTILALCTRYVTERETARDVMQDGFVKVFTKINTYSGSGSFEGWMKRVFVTTALEQLRNDKQFRFHVDMEEYQDRIEDGTVSIVQTLSAEEILRCIQELPSGFRTVFNLYAIEGYSHAEIATALKIKEASSRSQYARARQLLQMKINKLYQK